MAKVTDARLKRLPKWAREYIADLLFRLKIAEAKAGIESPDRSSEEVPNEKPQPTSRYRVQRIRGGGEPEEVLVTPEWIAARDAAEEAWQDDEILCVWISDADTGRIIQREDYGEFEGLEDDD